MTLILPSCTKLKQEYESGATTEGMRLKYDCSDTTIRTKLRSVNVNYRPKNIPNLKGDKHPSWKGGTYTEDGYVFIRVPDYPYDKNRTGPYFLEHRWVMEKSIGRKLDRYEYVHHKNGVRNDNRLENLSILVAKRHYGEIKCPHCQEKFFIK